MRVVLDLLQQALFFQIRQHGFAAREAVQARVFLARCLRHLGVEADDRDAGQSQARARGVIVGVVGRGQLHAARAELGIDERIGHHGDRAIGQGQLHLLAQDGGVALVLGMHRHAGVAQQRLGARGGDHQMAAAIGVGIADVPELALLLLVFHFEVGQRRLAGGIPLDHARALADAALAVGVHEDLAHRAVQIRVHGEALARPVHAGAHAAQLVLDGALVLVLPIPQPLQKFLARQIVARLAFGLELALHHHLRGDARVIHAGNPHRVEPLRTLEARQRVVQREHQGVAHVQIARDVGRRDDDGPGLLAAVGISFEDLRIFPYRVPALLGGLEVESLVHFAHGNPI